MRQPVTKLNTIFAIVIGVLCLVLVALWYLRGPKDPALNLLGIGVLVLSYGPLLLNPGSVREKDRQRFSTMDREQLFHHQTQTNVFLGFGIFMTCFGVLCASCILSGVYWGLFSAGLMIMSGGILQLKIGLAYRREIKRLLLVAA